MPPELDPGPVRVLRPLAWRVEADHVALPDPRGGAEVRYHPWTEGVLEDLMAGRDYAQIVARVGLPDADRAARRFLFQLRQMGYLDLGFPPAPATLGSYRVEAELGRGGVGIAWRCMDARGERVVVKHAWAYFAGLAAADAHVRREAEMLRALAGVEGVPRLLATFDEGGLAHLVRAYVAGTPLPARRWREDESVALADRLARLVADAHDAGYALVDLQPQNVLVDDALRPTLVDVGLAAPLGSRVKAAGARGFVAPETARAGLVDARTDAWSLGRLLFVLATGAMPQAAWGEAEIARRVAGHPLGARVMALARDAPEARLSPASARA